MQHTQTGDGNQMFSVRRDRLSEFRMRALPDLELEDGAVELSVDRFAFTANNVTYGVVGDAFGYWNFFPTGEDGWGCIPVWGFGTVVRSRHSAISVGERFFGYYPMANRLRVLPGKVSSSGFVDGAAHRAGMSGIYNRYALTSADPAYTAKDEPLILLYRPLYGTAFFIDDFLAEQDFFGAEAVVFASASSKTAYSTAFLLSERRRLGARVQTIGLTSRGNWAFVKGLGVYDQVVEYEAIDSLSARPAVFFDMAGSGAVTLAVHRKFGDQLAHSAIVGSTHWNEGRRGAEPLPGPAPEMFFVPTLMEKRASELGPQELQRRLGAAWQAFTARVRDAGSGWLTVVEGSGMEAIERVYSAALAGGLLPQEGHILNFGKRSG